MKHLEAQDGFFQLIGLASDFLLDNKLQETAELRLTCQGLASQNLVELEFYEIP